MANWKAEMDIRTIWTAVQEDEATIGELIGEVVRHFKRLKKQRQFTEDEALDSFIEQFEEIMDSDDDEDEKRESFDAIWEEVYEWADDDHRLWIRTI